MEIKLSVSIGATLQVKNAKGEWDWIKPEVGCEVKLVDGEIKADVLPAQFAAMWDDVVGPQFASVVQELINEQSPKAEVEEAVKEGDIEKAVDSVDSNEEFIEKLTAIMEEKPNTDEDDYY
jgi:hypothetical protein